MVRIKVKEGFWGTLTVAMLAGCSVIGFATEHPTAIWVYLLAGCLVGMLTFGLVRDLVRAWVERSRNENQDTKRAMGLSWYRRLLDADAVGQGRN
jgi:hypothetical protein